MSRFKYLLLLLILPIWSCSDSSNQMAENSENSNSAESQKPRTVITSDGEVDDMDSFIRMLLYSNEFQVEGLVYSSSQWHYKGDGQGTTFVSEMEWTRERYGERTELRWPGTTWMQEFIGLYAEVYPNLTEHADGYPTPDYLQSIVRVGNIEFEGEMEKDTEGSEFIKRLLLDESNADPIYLQIWGGTNTVARALKSIQEEYEDTEDWEEIYERISDKAIIYSILDQDATYRKYIEPNWPDVRVFYNSAQFWSFAYAWPRVVPEELKDYLRGDFYNEYILEGHGPLLAQYYTWGDGRQIEGDPEHDHGNPEVAEENNMSKGSFISEGDSPSYLYLVDVGLSSLDNPSHGSWGGRMEQSESNPRRWEDGEDVVDYNIYTDSLDTSYPQVRWIDAIQNDFAARADWCVMSYEEANHAPDVQVSRNSINASPGERIELTASADDPDGDNVNFRWWQYWEVDSYESQIDLPEDAGNNLTFTVPGDARSGDDIHIILEGIDSGEPQLTRYQRVIIEVVEEN